MKRITLKIAIIIFTVEGLIMFGFAIAPPIESIFVEAFIDSTILIFLGSPLIYFWAIMPYVTAYQKLEQKHIETQQKLVAAIESMDGGFVIYNADDRLVLCNQKYREYYKDSAELIVPGAKFEDIIRAGAERGHYAQAIGRVDEWVAERMEQHRKADRSFEQQLDDNRWLRISERQMPDGGRAGIRVDITELKQVQAVLEKSREELELRVEERTEELNATRNELLQAAKIARLGHWRFDEVKNEYLVISVEFARIFGFTIEEFMNRYKSYAKDITLQHPDDSEMYIRAHHLKEDMELDYRILQRDGEVRYVREICEYISDENGKVIESVGTLQDITELKRSQLKAEAANLARSRFLSTMSHELRTPLNAILGYSEMLSEEAEEAGQRAMLPDLERINLSGRHLLDLIDDILDLSKIEAGRMELALEPIDVDALVREVFAAVQPLVEQNGNRFELESDKNIGSMRVDPARLRQILLNLLSNAGKFTQNGRVELLVQKQSEWIVFRVSDSGIGIIADQLEQVFDAFRQVDDSSTRAHDGSGLGLAISKRLCELMGGAIEVQSEPGAGSIFTVRLPLQPQVDASIADREMSKSDQAGQFSAGGDGNDGSE